MPIRCCNFKVPIIRPLSRLEKKTYFCELWNFGNAHLAEEKKRVQGSKFGGKIYKFGGESFKESRTPRSSWSLFFLSLPLSGSCQQPQQEKNDQFGTNKTGRWWQHVSGLSWSCTLKKMVVKQWNMSGCYIFLDGGVKVCWWSLGWVFGVSWESLIVVNRKDRGGKDRVWIFWGREK